jgi:hypothetical protein
LLMPPSELAILMLCFKLRISCERFASTPVCVSKHHARAVC